jgi:ABC-type polysaccharide/polyol phosphate transport system ATPase subunit
MQQEYAIDVKNITKSFKVYLDRSDNLKDFIIHSNRRKFENREVLKGISFKVKKGEAIGLVGRNGCGKSTTLKLLTRIMYPDTGEIKINGRVSSLIELGAGFHPDMSGRENIYINASIFGLSRKEIDRRVKKIIAFSELEDYIDNPVRTYSSGMYMRLAFSVAINVDADVLLIDEILAVGDANFQAKCFQKLRDIKESGTTIVIVSHALGQIESICERSIWIENGKIKAEGEPRKVHREYLQYMGMERWEDNQESISKNTTIDTTVNREGNHKVVFEKIQIFDLDGKVCHQFERGDSIIIEAQYRVIEEVKNGYFALDLIREDDNMYCFASNTNFSLKKKVNLISDGKLRIKLKNVPLAPQRYFIDLILKEGNTEPIDIVRHAVDFEMFSYEKCGGITYIDTEWEWTDKNN